MNSKERVYAALRHEITDRVPKFIWLGGGVAERMSKKYNIKPCELDVVIGNDVLQTWLSINREMARDLIEGEIYIDEWGIKWKREGYHNMVIFHPLAGMNDTELGDYPFPDPYDKARYEPLISLIKNYGESHFIGADISGTLFEPAYHLRGMDEFLLDLAADNSEAQILLDKLEDFSTKVAVEGLRLGADWIWLGDDMGTQNGMIISPSMWRRFFKPRMIRIIKRIRDINPDVFIAYHSCGSMKPIIPDLVEIGIDVLNPLQESAAGMDQCEVKCLYGDKITLMCGLDTQIFMPDASPGEIRTAVMEKIEKLGRNGGFIFAASHSIQHDVPDENVMAFLSALGG